MQENIKNSAGREPVDPVCRCVLDSMLRANVGGGEPPHGERTGPPQRLPFRSATKAAQGNLCEKLRWPVLADNRLACANASPSRRTLGRR
jgi:hypothetical protein